MPLSTEPRRSEALARAITDAIRSGELAPGSRLPSERELCDRFSVSRTTVRRAVAELVHAGLLRSEAGRGTFVADGRIGEEPNQLLSFTELARGRGLTPSATVLDRRVVACTLDEAAVFGVAPGAPLVRLQRVRRLDGLPVALDTTTVPRARAPESEHADFASASLYEVLAAAGHAPVRADYSVEAVAADGEAASALDVPPGFPLLRCGTLGRDRAGLVVERGVTLYRGDRYRFTATLLANGG